MTDETPPQWLAWAREIQALAQTSDAFSKNEFQRERFACLMDIAAEMVGTHTGIETDTLAEVCREQMGYATPKVDVRAAAFREGKILMVREAMDGGWCLPGGWADVGDVPSEAAERETMEEAGFEVRAKKVIGVYDANRIRPLELFHAFKIIFLCEIVGGEARTSMETTEVAFYGREEIPANFAGERTKARHIEDAFAALGDPGIATVFD